MITDSWIIWIGAMNLLLWFFFLAHIYGKKERK
jgi:hypothetical protein